MIIDYQIRKIENQGGKILCNILFRKNKSMVIGRRKYMTLTKVLGCECKNKIPSKGMYSMNRTSTGLDLVHSTKSRSSSSLTCLVMTTLTFGMYPRSMAASIPRKTRSSPYGYVKRGMR